MNMAGPSGEGGTSRISGVARQGAATLPPGRKGRAPGKHAARYPGKVGGPEGKQTLRNVALLIETSGSYGRGLLRGVARYNREHGGWSTYFHPRGLGQPPPAWLGNWKGDGVLVRIDSPQLTETLLRSNLPVVNLRGTVPEAPFPAVKGDHLQVAKMAADHLLERGLQHFAFCGRLPGLHSGLDERCAGFCRAVEASGHICHVFPAMTVPAQSAWDEEQEQLAAWIKDLPKPLGVMACNDERGLHVLDACRRADVSVPDEAAVIGVDNDEYLCELSIPPLTSVDVNAEQIGYDAAALLDKLMDGEKPASGLIVIPPRGVVTRLSTDIVASEDEEVNRAIRFIRERGCNGLRVMDVLAHLGISRASLQQRMKRVIGRTIHEEIERMRLTRVKELLLKPDMTIKQVARETGFSSVQYLTRVFRAAVGETPARYRNHRDK